MMNKSSTIWPTNSSIIQNYQRPRQDSHQKYQPTNSTVFDLSHQNETGPEKKHTTKNHKLITRICIIRGLLVFSLLLAGAISATLSFLFIRDYEDQLYEEEFEAIVSDVYQSVDSALVKKMELLVHFSLLMGFICPNTTNWPNCSVPSVVFDSLTSSLNSASESRSIGVAPIVTLDQKAGFENYAYDFFQSDGGFPPNTGISPSFGRGIWKRENFTKYPDLTGNANFSNYSHIFVPIFYVSDIPRNYPGIMYNMHSEPIRGTAIDGSLDCTKLNPGRQYLRRCTSITDVIQLVSDNRPSPGSVIYTPIYPFSINESTSLPVVGMATLIFNWVSVLSFNIPAGYSVYCILETNSVEHVFLIQRNGTMYLGKDCKMDFEDSFDPNLQRIHTVVENTEILTTTEYKLHFISHRTFYEAYHSNLPIIACITCLLIILIISTIFILFDFFSKRDAAKNVALLDSKRVFVRFISHEIRSPLNTIVLGLDVLRNKVLKLLPDEMLTHEKGGEVKEQQPPPPLLAQSPLLETSTVLTEYNPEEVGDHIPSRKSHRSRKSMIRNEFIECLEIIQELNDNTEAAVVVLNDLINYDKIELKTFTIEIQEIDLGVLLEKTYNSLFSQAKQKNIDLSYRLDNSPSTRIHSPKTCTRHVTPSQLESNEEPFISFVVNGDSVKLGQVFRNVISNALKLTPTFGKVSIDVQWTDNENGQYVYISVTDTGPGLSAEQLSVICSEGVQFNPNQLQAGGGSGLGLWISQQIVDLHGGKMTISSAGLGLGATFQIKLPYLKTLTTPTQSHQNTIATTPEKPQFTQLPKKILLVDDTPSNRKMLGRILKINHISFDEAENGQICIDKVTGGNTTQPDITNCPYDLILLDYEMPVLNGPKTAQMLRQLGYQIIIIGVTGNVLPEDRDYFIRHGVNAVLPKPVTIQSFMEVYETLLAEKNSS